MVQQGRKEASTCSSSLSWNRKNPKMGEKEHYLEKTAPKKEGAIASDLLISFLFSLHCSAWLRMERNYHAAREQHARKIPSQLGTHKVTTVRSVYCTTTVYKNLFSSNKKVTMRSTRPSSPPSLIFLPLLPFFYIITCSQVYREDQTEPIPCLASTNTHSSSNSRPALS